MEELETSYKEGRWTEQLETPCKEESQTPRIEERKAPYEEDSLHFGDETVVSKTFF